jgi:hypothetical protein
MTLVNEHFSLKVGLSFRYEAQLNICYHVLVQGLVDYKMFQACSSLDIILK